MQSQPPFIQLILHFSLTSIQNKIRLKWHPPKKQTKKQTKNKQNCYCLFEQFFFKLLKQFFWKVWTNCSRRITASLSKDKVTPKLEQNRSTNSKVAEPTPLSLA